MEEARLLTTATRGRHASSRSTRYGRTNGSRRIWRWGNPAATTTHAIPSWLHLPSACRTGRLGQPNSSAPAGSPESRPLDRPVGEKLRSSVGHRSQRSREGPGGPEERCSHHGYPDRPVRVLDAETVDLQAEVLELRRRVRTLVAVVGLTRSSAGRQPRSPSSASRTRRASSSRSRPVHWLSAIP